MHHRRTLAFMIITLAATCSLAVAQGRGQGQGQGQGRGQSGVDRLMENDANGDGKLSRDELPERFAARIFEQADSDGDGFITRVELKAVFAERGERGGERGQAGGPRGPRGQGPATEASFDAHMMTIQRSIRRLNRSDFTAESRSRDLEMITAIQMAFLRAKSSFKTVPAAAAGKKKFADEAAYTSAFRMQLLDALAETVTVERAILTRDAGAAKASIKRLVDIRNKGHELFKPEDDDDAAGGGKERPESGRRGRP